MLFRLKPYERKYCTADPVSGTWHPETGSTVALRHRMRLDIFKKNVNFRIFVNVLQF